MEFVSYLSEVFLPFNFLLLLLGTVGGLILGATPGLSPTMAVALLIPFTFQLAPAQGLILLGAAYTSTVAGGAVSAILLKIPVHRPISRQPLTAMQWRKRARVQKRYNYHF